MFDDALIPPDPLRADAAAAARAQLTGPGPTLSRHERADVIHTARRAWGGLPIGQPTLLQDVARWLAIDAGGITEAAVATLESAGLDRFRYLEIVGVVSRLANVDFYARGVGASVPAVPDLLDAAATGEVAANAAVHDGWVPSTGPLQAITALEALPAEARAFKALHEPFYVPFREFFNGAYRDALDRQQIEWVAARTSYLNECFY